MKNTKDIGSCYLLIIWVFAFVDITISGCVLEKARGIGEILIEVSMCIKVVDEDVVFVLGVEQGDTGLKQVIERFHHLGNSMVANMGRCMLHGWHIDNQERTHTIRVQGFLHRFHASAPLDHYYTRNSAYMNHTNCSL